METGYDENAAGDIESVARGREMVDSDIRWVTRALVGAFRPNRDLPFFILAHAIAALCVLRSRNQRRRPVDDLVDPTLSHPARFAALFADAAEVSSAPEGFGLPWFESPVSHTVGRRCLALAELLMTTDECEHFGAVARIVDLLAADPTRAGVQDASRALGRIAHQWRQKHVPLAAIERQIRKVATFLNTRGKAPESRAPKDETILDYFAAESAAGDRPVLRTVVELFLTIERAFANQRFRGHLQNSVPLDLLLPSDEFTAQLLEDVVGEGREAVESAVAAIPEMPRMLKGTERDALLSLLSLEPFTTTLPLTVLRTLSFETVQSGILNRLRRGSGGPEVAERVRCEAAVDYDGQRALARELDEHLVALLRIAYAIRDRGPADPDEAGDDDGDGAERTVHQRSPAVAKAGLSALRSMRRAGFDAPEEVLREAFGSAEPALVRLRTLLREHLESTDRMAQRLSLGATFDLDRAFFADHFARAYLASTGGLADDTSRT